MSFLNEAFKIPINPENKDFVTHPYRPIECAIGCQSHERSQLLTTARYIDVKYGTEALSYPIYSNSV